MASLNVNDEGYNNNNNNNNDINNLFNYSVSLNLTNVEVLCALTLKKGCDNTNNKVSNMVNE
jgi:hypothetical protein